MIDIVGNKILHYEILEQIGHGGMGVVYKAHDEKLDRLVALKFLPHNKTPEKESLQRLLNEAKSASALNHPNVCIIHSIEQYHNHNTEQPDQFIVMEYVFGTTLRKKIEEGPQKISDALSYAIQIAEALKEAHVKGIAHLDIKSDNIMINSKNQIKVMDFGLAKLRDSASEQRYESTYGTAAYMSPEQAMGKPAGFLSDIWSFGVVIYEMLTGKLPFIHHYDAAILYSILNESPAAPSEVRPDLPSGLESIILKCLQKEEDKRFQNPDEILQELNRIKTNIETESIRETVEKEQKKEVKKETEQKQATIVYMKIQNYSELMILIGNERIVEILGKCYDLINQITLKYSGTINKTEANNIVLYFGLPTAIENASLKALTTAIEISNRLTELSKDEKLPLNLTLNAGINTGIVIAGSILSGKNFDYTVIGDTVEIASKLLELSSEGQILLGPLTFRYTKKSFDIKPYKSISLKGKRDPLKIYRLESFKEKTAEELKVDERLIKSEMVGRQQELDKLEFLLLKAINGQGSIVSIIAEAGIGKSRLISEFKNKEILNRVLLLEGKALSTAMNVSFHPIISILKQWAQINENDNETQAFSKLENSISNLFQEEANEIIPFIAALMGFHLTGEYEKRINEVSPDALGKVIQKSMRLLILKGCELRPVVFIIEDLHWADLSSIELLQSLLKLAENNKILFVTTLRPNFQETGDKIITSVKEKYADFYTELRLNPLNIENCHVLLHNLLKIKNLPEQIKSSIYNSTEGNPFFIEEIIRSLIDDKVIEVNSKNEYQLTGEVENIIIPGTIRDVLLSRIDKLDEQTKNLLKIASVIGRYFLFEILAEVLGNDKEIEPRIQYLIKLELLSENKDSIEREYLFQHALIQEAVYDTLLSNSKKELHYKVASAIENLYEERISDFYEMLAHHYSLANDKEKAEEYLIKAGERTLKNAASNEALNYFREALKIYLDKYGDAADSEKIFMLEKNIGISFYNRGYFTESVEHFLKALNAIGIRSDRNILSETFRFVFNFLLILKQLYLPSKKQKTPPSGKDYVLFDILFKVVTAYANYDVKKLFFELVNLIRLKMNFDLKGEDGYATFNLAASLFSYGGISFALSKKFLEKAKNYAKINGIDDVYNNGYDETLYYCLSGNWKEFSKINEKLLEFKLRSGDIIYTIYQIAWALYITICRGENEYSEYLINKGDEIGEIYDFDYAKLYILSFKADLHLNRRNLHKSINYYTECCSFAIKLGLNSWILGLSSKRSKAYVLLNDFKSAKDSLDQAEKAMEKEESLPPMLLSYLMAYKLFYLTSLFENKIKESSVPKKEIAKLKSEIKKSIKYAVKVADNVAEIKPEVYRYLAAFSWNTNKSAKAFKYYRKSIDYAKHLEAYPELGRSYFEFGKYLLKSSASHNGESADNNFSEAKKIFEKFNLQWDLDELNRTTSNYSRK